MPLFLIFAVTPLIQQERERECVGKELRGRLMRMAQPKRLKVIQNHVYVPEHGVPKNSVQIKLM
jgi:hypothetical protein